MLKMLTSDCQMKIRRDSQGVFPADMHDIREGSFSDHAIYSELALASGGPLYLRWRWLLLLVGASRLGKNENNFAMSTKF